MPVVVTMRFFSLEFIMQNMNMDEIHFISKNKKAQFKLKAQSGPFIVNIRTNNKEVENI